MEQKKKEGFMGTATVGEKGQIVIPKTVRDMLGIRPGDELLILARQDKGMAIPPKEEAHAIREQILSAQLGREDK